LKLSLALTFEETFGEKLILILLARGHRACTEA